MTDRTIPANSKRSELEIEMEFQMKAAKLPPWELEYRFHPVRRWRFDFAWPDRKVALEVDGGAFSHGRHVRGVGFENDCEKVSEAAVRGWVLIRVAGSMVKDGRALDLVERALG